MKAIIDSVRRFGGWIRFVNGRRLDLRFPLFPPAQLLASASLALSLIAASIAYADPPFLHMYQNEPWQAGRFFEMLTHVGTSGWILTGTALVFLAVTLVPARERRRWVILLASQVQMVAWFLFGAVAFSGLLTNLFKFLLGRQRPPFSGPGEAWDAVPFTAGYEFASFPSGHSTTAGALAMGLALLFPRFRLAMLVLGMFVAISRPVLGVHFPSDVVGGLAVGAGFTWIWARSFARKRLLFAFGPRGELLLRDPLFTPRGRKARP